MKHSVAAAAALLISLASLPVYAGTVLAFTESDLVYGSQSGSITSGSGASDDLYFSAAVEGAGITVDLTNSAGVITDTLFSPDGQPYPFYAGDEFEFAGFNSGNAAIGQTCVAATDVTCVVNTGAVIDLTSIFDAEAQGNAYVLEGGDVTVQATDGLTATPEPSSLTLLGTGLLGAAGLARRRFLRA